MKTSEAKAKIEAAGLNPADFDCRAIATWMTECDADDATEIAEYIAEGLPVPDELVVTDRAREVHFWDSIWANGYARTPAADAAAQWLSEAA